MWCSRWFQRCPALSIRWVCCASALTSPGPGPSPMATATSRFDPLMLAGRVTSASPSSRGDCAITASRKPTAPTGEPAAGGPAAQPATTTVARATTATRTSNRLGCSGIARHRPAEWIGRAQCRPMRPIRTTTALEPECERVKLRVSQTVQLPGSPNPVAGADPWASGGAVEGVEGGRPWRAAKSRMAWSAGHNPSQGGGMDRCGTIRTRAFLDKRASPGRRDARAACRVRRARRAPLGVGTRLVGRDGATR